MQTPNVVHPRKIKVNETIFEVVSYVALSDQQALNVVRFHISQHGLKKKDKGKTVRIITVLDEQSARLFG